MNKLIVKDLIKEIKEHRNFMYFEYEFYKDLGEYFAEYASGYICDIITEIADSNVDIYTADLMKWNADNYSYVDDAMQEFGVPSEFDMVRAIQMGQYLCYERAMYENLSTLIKLNILTNIDAEEITQEVLDRIDEIADAEDNNACIEDYIQEINELTEKKEA